MTLGNLYSDYELGIFIVDKDNVIYYVHFTLHNRVKAVLKNGSVGPYRLRCLTSLLKGDQHHLMLLVLTLLLKIHNQIKYKII